MELYELPKSLAVDRRVHLKLKGELILSFGGSLLSGSTFRPLGLNALWSLVGALASLHKSFLFDVRPGVTELGQSGGFADGRFCLFLIQNAYIEVLTLSPIDPEGAVKVTLNDERHGTFFWIPDCAMTSFEDLVKLGNAVLLSEGEVYKTLVHQRYANWENDKYSS